MKNYATKAAEPCAFITTRKQRIKQNGDNVFLRNNEEFELELYNPLSTTILAKVKLNGNYIASNGLVLKPGQRVFLERYLDDSRKFKFETYEVSGDSDEIKQAIRNNGSVEVEFYLEYIPIQTINYIPPTTTLTVWPPYHYYDRYYYTSPTWTCGSGLGTLTTTSLSSTNTTFGAGVNSCYYSNSNIGTSPGSQTMNNINIASTYNSKDVLRSASPIKKIETGTIEKGSHSEQSFTYVDKTFNNFYTYRSSWKILPFSQKNIETEDLKVYCYSCGKKKRKDSDRYCSGCGTQF